MSVNIEELLEVLKHDKSLRTQRSIDALNHLLSEYFEKGGHDYSITTIGRLSAESGGVGYQSIRATANKHFRDIIEYWAHKAKTTTKKPISKFSRKKKVPKDIELLERIPDPALRVFFGQIIVDRDRLKDENKLLRSINSVIPIDRRQVISNSQLATFNNDIKTEILPTLKGIVTEIEFQSLRSGFSEDNLKKLEWKVTKLGQVVRYDGLEIFPRGFMKAINKILGEIDE